MAVDFVVTRVVRRFSRIAVAAVAAGAVATSSCGGGGDRGGITGTSTGTVASVTIAPTAVQVDVGGTATLQAQALDAGGNVLGNRTFVWSTSDSTIARVSADGRLTGIAAGTAEVAANVEGKFAKASVTVGPRAVATVQLAPDAPRLVVGATQQLTARTLYSDGSELTGRRVTWTSSDATVATVDTLGMLAATGPGVATITATSEGRSASVAVTVTAVPVGSIAVTPTVDTLVVGQSTQLSATVRDAGGAPLPGRAVAWSTSDGAIASVSSSGLVLAVAPGVANAIATADAVTGTGRIVVLPRPVGAVIISPSTSRLGVGGTVQLTTQVTDANGTLLTGRDVVFSSSDGNVATVSASGVVTGVGAGSVTITATSEGKTGTATVVVALAAIASIDVQPANPTIFVGDLMQLQTTLRDAAGNALTGRAVTWTTGAPAVVAVSPTGRLTALSPGTAVVVASAEGKVATVTVTVKSVPVASIRITPAGGTVAVGNAIDLVAVALDNAGTPLSGRTITFSSTNEQVAVVSSTGRVQGLAPGSAQIVASTEAVQARVTITVTPIPVASVAISGVPATLVPGNTAQLSATARDAQGNVLTGRAVTWSSSNVSAATVSSAGVLTAVGPGAATITATVDGVNGTATATVTAVAVATVTVALNPASVIVGQTSQATAVARDAQGNVLTGRAVTWSSSDGNVASVTATGALTGAGVGTATITATSEGKTGTATITVTPAPIATIAVSLANPALTTGGTTQATAVAHDANGNVLTGRAVTWSTSNANVATVSAAGVVTAVGNGTASITATSEGKSASATVTVTPSPVATVAVTLGATTLTVGGTTQATAVARDAGGTVLTGRAVTWATSNANVATVSSTGVVTAVGAGSASITATSEGKSGAATVTVTLVPVASVAVSLSASPIIVGGTSQATAVARDAQGNVLTGRAVTWSTSNASVATVSPAGVVTGVAPGTASITATSEGQTGSASIGVNAPAPTPVATVAVTIATSPITAGATTQASAVTRDAQGNLLTGRVVTWSSSNGNVATVSSTGVVTGVGAGQATITATSEGKSGTASISVNTAPPVPVATVAVSLGASSITAGATTQATAVVRDAQGNVLTGRGVTWSTSNANVATVSASGVVTGVGAGSASITATSEGKSGSATVTVTPPPVATVTVALGSASINIGGSTQATATLRDAQGNALTGRAVTWSSSNALVATVSGSGVVTALTPGTASITATSEGKSGSAGVTVTLIPVTSVSVSLASPSLTPGQTTQATATTLGPLGITLTGRTVTWSSSNANVATVSSTGVVTAVAPGSASIIATSEGVTGSATATVAAPAVATVGVTLGSAALTTGQTTQATAVARDASGAAITGVAVTWASLNTAVATVSPAGVVTAVAAGTASIQATAGGKTGAASVTVTAPAPAPVATVGVTLGTAALTTGQTTQATATPRDAQGNALTGRTVSWSSSNGNVATVSASGVVTAVGAGSATISATSEGKTGSAGVTVTAPIAPVATVAVALGTSSVVAGGGTQATATLRDAQGNTLTGRSVTWSSSNPSVATVSGTGAVSTVAPGTASITATSEGKTGAATLTVTTRPVARIDLNPMTVNLDLSSKRSMSVTAIAYDVSGTPIADAPLTWGTSDPSIATAAGSSTGGTVTGNKVGQATLFVSAGNVTATARIMVKD